MTCSLSYALAGAVCVVVLAACSSSDDDPSSDTSAGAALCVASTGDRLADIALKMDGKKSQQLCYHFVKAHLRAAGFSTTAVESAGFGRSAFMFARWADKFPADLARMGLTKVTPSLDDLPRGAILVWGPGQCGYSKTDGHIEIVADNQSSKACSDFCGHIKKNCGLPEIFVPTACTAPSATGDEVVDTSDRSDAEHNDAAPTASGQ
jgi:hypothetical protein